MWKLIFIVILNLSFTAQAGESLNVALGSCRATGASDRFVVYAAGQTKTCAQACAEVKCGANAKCVKGWTTFPNPSLFEYGNECSTAATSAQWMAGKLCCCTGTGCAQPSNQASGYNY